MFKYFSFVGSPPPAATMPSEAPQVASNSVSTVPQLPSSDAFAAVAQLFQTTQGQQVSRAVLYENKLKFMVQNAYLIYKQCFFQTLYF